MIESPVMTGGLIISRPAPLNYSWNSSIGFQLLSDLHYGAAHIDESKIKRELDDAASNGDRININGDVFDAILTKDLKRFTPDCIHPRFQGRKDLVNAWIDYVADQLAPYAHLIDVIGVGNHETAVEKYHGTDITKFLIDKLSMRLAGTKHAEHVIHYGGYCGFIDYRFHYVSEDGVTREAREGQPRSKRLVIFYHHGSGGAAPVTKGMIDFNRKDTWVDADVIWMGHKHNRWSAHVQRVGCPANGDDPKIRDVRHIMTGAYFRTYSGQTQASIREKGRMANYAADWGVAPQGCGGARLMVNFPSRSGDFEMKVMQ